MEIGQRLVKLTWWRLEATVIYITVTKLMLELSRLDLHSILDLIQEYEIRLLTTNSCGILFNLFLIQAQRMVDRALWTKSNSRVKRRLSCVQTHLDTNSTSVPGWRISYWNCWCEARFLAARIFRRIWFAKPMDWRNYHGSVWQRILHHHELRCRGNWRILSRRFYKSEWSKTMVEKWFYYDKNFTLFLQDKQLTKSSHRFLGEPKCVGTNME